MSPDEATYIKLVGLYAFFFSICFQSEGFLSPGGKYSCSSSLNASDICTIILITNQPPTLVDIIHWINISYPILCISATNDLQAYSFKIFYPV